MNPSPVGPLGTSAPPSPRISAQDRNLYYQWFQLADLDRDGRVTGPDAVDFFGRSGLPRDQLAKVWAFADNTRRGYLDFEAFIRALELISLAQHTGSISLENYSAQQAIGILPPRMTGLQSNPSSPVGGGSGGSGSGSGGGLPGSNGASTSSPGQTPPSNPFAPTKPTTTATDGPSIMAIPPSPPSGGAPPPMFYFGGPTAVPAGINQQATGADPRPSSAGKTGAFATASPSAAGNYTGIPSPMPPLPSPRAATGRDGGRSKDKKGGGGYLMTTKDATSITDGLRKIYFNKIRPLEEAYKFGHFFSPLLSEGDFEAKPSVLLLGQYSTGKTTFIKYLLGRDYPGLHIGPEPTTDRFVVVMHGPEDRRTPGNTLVVQPDKPFTGLAQFGNGFLSKFECATCENRLLEEITLVDTPGVLSGEKQRVERSYDFIQVCGWFAARCDLILLLFDPYKLDISDEFKAVISTLKGHDDKVRVVLNKADQVDQQQLMRVYGALMWSLGKVFRAPEVCRVYIGSFNAATPIREDVNPTGKKLFEKEQEDLLHDLYDIPARSCDRKVNEFVKRIRAAKIHFLIMGHLRKQMPFFGQKKAQDKLLANLSNEFAQVQREHHLHPGDFPDVGRYREILSAFDISKFPKLDKQMMKQVDDALSIDIPNLVRSMDNPYL